MAVDTMSDVDVKKLAVGALLLVVGTAIILSVGLLESTLPIVLGSLAALSLAAGALLLGTSERGRPV